MQMTLMNTRALEPARRKNVQTIDHMTSGDGASTDTVDQEIFAIKILSLVCQNDKS